MEPRHHYLLSGLHVESTIALPMLAEAEPAAVADVTIRRGRLPYPDRLPESAGRVLRASPRELLFAIRDVGTFRVRDGRDVMVSAAPGADERAIRVYLLGTCFGVLCHQRGLLPLHASAVRAPEGCAAFSAPSGTGKSTLAAWLAQRGHPLITDDVCVLESAESDVRVLPAHPYVKVWDDGLEALAAERSGLSRVWGLREKFHMALSEGFTVEPVQMRWLYLVADGEGPAIERVSGLDAVAALVEATYRLPHAVRMGLESAHFRLCASVSAVVGVYRLRRPRGLERMEETLEALEAHWRGGQLADGRPGTKSNSR
jgi:hypothetical protein